MSFRILIVDDEPDLSEMLQILFEAQNFAVTCAKSGREALALCENQAFDFILTDERMPGGTGTEFLLALQKSGRPLPPIAMMTGHSEMDADEKKQIGFLSVIKKPFIFKDVHNFILEEIRKTGRSG